MEWLTTLGIGLIILCARMIDVTIGTLRVISVIDGRIKMAFILGFVEVLIWLSVITVTLSMIQETRFFALFFALGFSLGNVLGIVVERRIPLGNLTLRIVGGDDVRQIATQIRDLGLGATLVKGEGRDGERNILFVFMPKKMLKKVRHILEAHRERVFYTVDYGGSANKVLLPAASQPTSPRRFFKHK